MKLSLLVACCFIGGVFVGQTPFALWVPSSLSMILLFALLFLVMMGTSMDPNLESLFDTPSGALVWVPLTTVVGSLLFALIISPWFSKYNLKDLLLLCGGFGYYSYSSVFIKEVSGTSLGTLALLTNVFREILTLFLAFGVRKLWGSYACIAMGGATVSDSTLPVILKACGKEYAVVAIATGISITFLVPILLMSISVWL